MNYRTLIKIKVVLYALFLCISFAFAQNNENTSAFNKYMSPEGGINPMSGTVALQKDVASISAGQIKTNLSLKYAGNVFREATRSNDEVKGGIVGLGWSMGRAKIVCDCKKNSFLDDDIYYLVTADGTRYKIFEEKAWRKQFNVDYDSNAKERWWVEGNPFWKVEPVIGEAVLPDVGGVVWKYIKGWNITDAEGVVHTYGDTLEVNSLTGPKANATEYDLVWLQYKDKNGLSQPAFGLMEDAYGGEPSYYPIAWNLSRETALDGSSLVYSYEQIIERLSGVFYWENKEKKTLWNPDEGYTKEIYLKEVRSSNNARIKLFYEEKGKDKFWGEFLDDEGEDEDLSDSGSDMFKERFERKFLSYIETYGPSEKDSGEYLGKVVFCYTPLQEGTPFVKRLLSAVRFYNKNDIQVDFEEYSYYDNVNASKISNTESAPFPLGALYKVNGKDCGWVEYTYEYESMGNGHVEELPLDSIYGQGYLEDGTHYLVGKKDESLKIYTRILGRWVLTDLKEDVDGTMQDVPAASRVDFGDAGWFMAVKKNSVAKIFQWNGREWQRVKSQEYSSSEITSPLDFSDFKEEEVLAGPDYALCYKKDDQEGWGWNDGYLNVNIFWTKWGGNPTIDTLYEVDDDKNENFKIKPQKNHILVQYQDGSSLCTGNCLRYYVYTFRNGFLRKNFADTTGLDSENDIYINGSFLADVGEGYYWWDDSRVIIYNWNGHEWVKQIKYLFSNSDPANVEASGSDYFAVRYLDGRHLRVFAFENNSWNGEALHDKLFNYDLLDDFHWEGKGSEDFFVTTRSYRNKWYQDVQHNKQIKLYYHKNGNPWQSIDYGRLKNYEGDKKVMVVGKDWFLEKNESRFAWIWNGTEWVQEDLKDILDKDVYGEKDIYSLGGNMLAASAKGKTRIIYKVNDSFLNENGTYLVRSKKILEPVADRIIEYQYSFLPRENAKNGVAFDEASNTPLMDVMKIELPDGKGIVERELCDIVDGVESVAVGSVCLEKQWAQGEKSIISQTKTYFARNRQNWPYPVYLDRDTARVEVARGIKTVIKNKYSETNGMLVRRTKTSGLRSTMENYLFVSDLTGLSEDEELVVENFKEKNRLNVLAGAYSCVKNCADGAVAMASANGLSVVDGLMAVTSTWKYVSKMKVSENTLKAHIKNISLNSQGNASWERQSHNSKYANRHVVETVEGPRNVKVASFYENSEHGKMYGSAANCGLDEGLMLSGESCNVINWENCDNDSLQGSAKDAVRLGRTDYAQFGRFSKWFVKLGSRKPLVGTIPNARDEEYTFSAWMQYGSVNGTLALSINDNVVHSWETRPSTLPRDSVGKWTRIEWKGRLNGMTKVALSVQNVSSFVPVQDIRVLPSNATSTTSFWNQEWNKVETSVSTKGIASYVAFDDIGRETEHYSETVEGDVYLSSKTTYVDGNCTEFPNGSDELASLLLNGRVQKLPPATGSRSATYTLSDRRVFIDFSTVGAQDGVMYRLYAQGTAPDKWMSAECGTLCGPSFSFTSQAKTWILEIDVAPYSQGIYRFTLKKRENDWVEYGAYDGFAKGTSPRFVNDFDSSFVAYKTKLGTIDTIIFNGNAWSQGAQLGTDYVAFFDVSTGKNRNLLGYIPNEDNGLMEYPKIFKVSKSSAEEMDVSDKALRADYLKLGENVSGDPVLLFNKTDKIVVETNPDNPLETKNKFLREGTLSAMEWNEARAKFVYLGNSPVFDYNRAVVDKEAKTVSFNTGEITSYLQGVINEKESASSDVVVGPDDKLYVAYVSTSKYFDWCGISESTGNNGSCHGDVPFVYMKRLYKASEVTGASADIWAGVSQTNGKPLFQGDILSWTGNPFDAVAGVDKLKLAYDNGNFYLAVSYDLMENGDSDEEESSSSMSSSSSSSSSEYHLRPTHALSVFRGSVRKNVTIDNKFYTTYLEWVPLKDLSVNTIYRAKSVDEEQVRIAYLSENDDFDFAVRNGVPYLMFRNDDNDGAISVISFKDDRWLSVGNPGFAYPQNAKGSVDLGVNKNGNPFVVFRAKNSIENIGRKDRIVSMRYNKNNASDITLDKFETDDDNFNKSCAFRQYILHYVANLDEVDNFIFKATPKNIGAIKEMQVVSNKKYLMETSNFSNSISIPLEKGLNEVELRLVGYNGNTLSYRFDLYRKFIPSPNFYTVGLMANTIVGLSPNGTAVIDVIPNSIANEQMVTLDLHFTAGWILILEINGKRNEYDVASTVEIPIGELPLYGEFKNEKNGETIPVIIRNPDLPIDNPEILPWYSSSSEGAEPEEESSSSVSKNDMSENVPNEIRNLTEARLFTYGQMDLADNVVVNGTLFAGGNVNVGVSASVSGDVFSNENVTLRNRCNVGNVYYRGRLEVQDGAYYGSSTQLPSTVVPAIPSFEIVAGSTNIIVEPQQARSLLGGKYGDFIARANTVVNFAAGDYYFRDFYTDSNARLNFAPGSRVWIKGNLRIGNDNRLLQSGEVGDLFVYVAGNASLETNVEMHAVLVVPNNNLSVSVGSHIYGYLIAKSLNIQPNVIVE